MRVSVIIPTYNRAQILPRALTSALEQIYPDLEVIVVDDGSVDTTAAVVEALARGSSRQVRYIPQPHRGCAAARNKGLAHACGDLVLFLDSDDALLPSAVASLSAVLSETGADFVYSPAIEIYPDGREMVNLPVAAGDPKNFSRAHFFCTNVRNGAVLFRRNVVLDVSGFDETLLHNEDSDLLQRVALRSRAAYAPNPTVRVYHHADQKSDSRAAVYRALLKSTENILREYPDFAATLGVQAIQRVAQVRMLLLEALVLERRFSEAAAVAPLLTHVRYDLRSALLFRSAFPVILRHKAQRIADRIKAYCTEQS